MTLTTVLARQRRPLLVAGMLAAGVLWISIPAGRAQVGVFFAVGVFLSLLNHVLTEVGLARTLASAGEVSRKQFAVGSLGRLAIVTLIAFVIVAAFWPYGAAVFVGLALMHLVMLIFTGLPLLEEMRKA
ncbi:MAG: ATP synthase subunit I [Nocardioidaceae bacterium]